MLPDARAPPLTPSHHTHIAGGSDGRNSVSPQRRQRSDHLEKPGSLMRASGKGVCSHDRLLFAVYFGSLCLFATAVTSLLRPFFVSFPPCFSLCLFSRPFCLLIAFLFFDVFPQRNSTLFTRRLWHNQAGQIASQEQDYSFV